MVTTTPLFPNETIEVRKPLTLEVTDAELKRLYRLLWGAGAFNILYQLCKGLEERDGTGA